MKQSDNLTQLSNEELTKSFKTAKGIFIGFLVIFILLNITSIFITFKNGFSIFTMLPVVFIPILIANIFNFGKIKEEMKNRNLLQNK